MPWHRRQGQAAAASQGKPEAGVACSPLPVPGDLHPTPIPGPGNTVGTCIPSKTSLFLWWVPAVARGPMPGCQHPLAVPRDSRTLLTGTVCTVHGTGGTRPGLPEWHWGCTPSWALLRVLGNPDPLGGARLSRGKPPSLPFTSNPVHLAGGRLRAPTPANPPPSPQNQQGLNMLLLSKQERGRAAKGGK